MHTLTETVTYRDLVSRYGHPMAYSLLLTIERSAKIAGNVIHIDEEARLKNAFDRLENTSAVG